MSFAVAIGASSISIFADGEYHTIESSNPSYATVLAKLKETPRDEQAILDLLDVPRMVIKASEGRVQIADNQVMFKNKEVGGYMVDRLLELAGGGHDVSAWLRFMDNLMDNPADGVREDLYRWMESGNLPITDDGCLVAFKKVRQDFTDVHTGKFDNSPGSILEMPRDKCDPSRTNTCSTGYHFCSAGYLPTFGGSRVVTVKINPRDVTAIPKEYGNQKGRCCLYTVVGELKNESAAKHKVWSEKKVVNLEDPAELPDVMLPRELQRKPAKGKATPKVKSTGPTPSKLKPDPKRTKGAPPIDDLAGKVPSRKGAQKGGKAPEQTKPPKEKAVAKKTSVKKVEKKTPTTKAAKPAAKKTPARKAETKPTKSAVKKAATKTPAVAKTPARKAVAKKPVPKAPVKVAKKPAAKKASSSKGVIAKATNRAGKVLTAAADGVERAAKAVAGVASDAVATAKPARKRPSRAKK